MVTKTTIRTVTKRFDNGDIVEMALDGNYITGAVLYELSRNNVRIPRGKWHAKL